MDLLKKRRRWILVAIIVLVPIPVLAIAWWLGSPLLIDKTVEEEFPFAHAAVVPPNMTMDDVEAVMKGMSKVESAMEDPMLARMAEATVIKTGTFKGVDAFHSGTGTATIYRLPDGTYVLRVESFRVTNGPDLRMVLTPHPDPRGRGDVTQGGYVELGKLKGNVGNQNYPLPASADPTSFNAVVVYCKPFAVLFSVAKLN